MKRISFGGPTMATGDAAAHAILRYSKLVVRQGSSVSIEVPVVDADGAIVQRTVLLGPAQQIEIVEDGPAMENEDELFPVPTFEPIGGKAIPRSSEDSEHLAPNLDDYR